MIKLEDEKTKALWLEISSQILNGCFTILAFYYQPMRFLNLVRILRFLFIRNSRRQNNEQEQRLQTYAEKINKDFPQVKLESVMDSIDNSTETVSQESLEQVGRREYGNCSPNLFLMIMIIMNLNCIFQYPITIVMWAWAANPEQRPVFIVHTFLPLSFLAGMIGGLMLFMVGRREKRQRLDDVSPDPKADIP